MDISIVGAFKLGLTGRCDCRGVMAVGFQQQFSAAAWLLAGLHGFDLRLKMADVLPSCCVKIALETRTGAACASYGSTWEQGGEAATMPEPRTESHKAHE